METHPAVGDPASGTASSATHESKKIESCAVVNDQEDGRTCESQSLSTSTTTTATTTTTTTTEQDQPNIVTTPLDIYGNNNTSNNGQSVNSFMNHEESQRQPQPSDSNSTSRLSNNDNSIVNKKDNNDVSKYQEEEQQHQQQNDQVDSDMTDSQYYQNEGNGVRQDDREESEDQTRLIDQLEQPERSRREDNGNNMLESHNVSQDEHIATTDATTMKATEQSDIPSINEGEDGSTPREKQRSHASTNDDQGELSCTAALDERITQSDTPSLDGNQDEERHPHAADQSSLSSAQQLTVSEHSEEDIDIPHVHTEEQSQQEQNGGHVGCVAEQQQNSNYYGNNNDNDDEENVMDTGYEREERASNLVVEVGNEEHGRPDGNGSDKDVKEEPDQTQQNAVDVESSTSSRDIEEHRRQVYIQSFPSLEGQGASSQALEDSELTEARSNDEASSHTVEEQQQVNVQTYPLSENQGISSRTLGGAPPVEGNSDAEAPSLPIEQEQQLVDIQSTQSLEADGAHNVALDISTPTQGHATDEVSHEQQSQQYIADSSVDRTGTQQQQRQEQEQEQHQNIGIYEYQQHSATINHDRDDASDHTLHSAPRSRRIWEADRQASECRRCNRRFNFLVRRHHCRRCGLVVCDRCSSHRIRLPPEEIVQDPAIDPSHYPLIAIHPQRVCDVCNRLPIKEVLASSSSSPRRRATAPVSMSHMKRSPSSQSLMTECPVCGTDLLGMQKEDQEKHLQLCLNTGSPPVRPPRYLVYELSENSPQIDYECPICFEEFKAGEKIARMICLCSYHRHCLSDWLERGKGCPVHYDAAISA